jgi:hypothetical protein
LTNPTSAETGVVTPASFTWTATAGAQGYWLNIGTTPGSQNLLSTGTASNVTSYSVPALPPGTTLYAQLYTEEGGSYGTPQSISFTTVVTSSTFTNPTNAETGVVTPGSFTWTATAGAQGYWLNIGTTPGSQNLVSAGTAAGVTSYSVPALPPGTTLYAELYTEEGGNYGTPQSISFTTAVVTSTFTNPTNAETGVVTPGSFTWTATAGAQGYWLNIGTTLGSQNLVSSGTASNVTSYSVPALPPGTTLYAQLYTEEGGSYGTPQSISFTTAG